MTCPPLRLSVCPRSFLACKPNALTRRLADSPPEKKPSPVKKPIADNSDGEDADFEEDFDDDNDDDSSDDDDDELDPNSAPTGGEVEAEDLEGGAGPSDSSKKRKAEDETAFGRIEHGLSGDEVDAGNIIEGGRRARRGRGGGDGKPKYTAKAEVASDEDSW